MRISDWSSDVCSSDLWSEHFVLPLSHDEVVHLKKPLLGKMPGGDDDRFANLRALYAWMWAHPGNQLLFMGAELAETREWTHDLGLAWGLLQDPRHPGITELIRSPTAVPAQHPAPQLADADPPGSPSPPPHDAHPHPHTLHPP